MPTDKELAEIDQFIIDATTRKSHNISDFHTKFIREQILPVLEKRTYLPQYIALWAVTQRRGRCYPKQRRITIPTWVFQANISKTGYLIWYVAHELAHQANWDETTKIGKREEWDNHGPNFMKQLQRICPEEYIHYEINYKPKNAMAAGIKNPNDIDYNKL